MSKVPIAVLISDVHYSLPTLEVADTATRMAIGKANELGVPLIVPGDLHDSKAHLRGECVKAMLSTFSNAQFRPIVLRGNHDAINEKSKEHSLTFLQYETAIIDSPEVMQVCGTKLCLIPYFSDIEELREFLRTAERSLIYIMHQGVQSTNAGHYYQDKSALIKEDLAGMRVISGHYHARQSFDLPNRGTFDYVGNPYTLNFGEANDPEKGFQILYNDGSLEFIATNLRRHIIMEIQYEDLKSLVSPGDHTDILWVKVKGTREQLAGLPKNKVAHDLVIQQDFKLDLIPLDAKSQHTESKLSKVELLDSMIDSLTNTSAERKIRLKSLWRDL